MDWRMFSPASRSRHHRCRYCQPMSECGIGSASSGSFSSSMASRRRCWAMSGCRLTSRATISLDPMSYAGAGYALPSATLNSVTSVPSFTHGRSAVKSRIQQVLRPRARLVPVRAVFPVRVRPAYPAFQAHAPHDLQHALVAHPHPELVHEAHAYLPVAAPVGRAREYLGDHRLDVRPGRRPDATEDGNTCFSPVRPP